MEIHNFAGIDDSTVDDVVLNAMSMLVDGEACAVTSTIQQNPNDLIVAVSCDMDEHSAVILRCSHTLAQSLTGRLLELHPDDLDESSVVDATGELVNMIAGNLRGLLYGVDTMTMPFRMDAPTFAKLRTHAQNAYKILGEDMQLVRV